MKQAVIRWYPVFNDATEKTGKNCKMGENDKTVTIGKSVISATLLICILHVKKTRKRAIHESMIAHYSGTQAVLF